MLPIKSDKQVIFICQHNYYLQYTTKNKYDHGFIEVQINLLMNIFLQINITIVYNNYLTVNTYKHNYYFHTSNNISIIQYNSNLNTENFSFVNININYINSKLYLNPP